MIFCQLINIIDDTCFIMILYVFMVIVMNYMSSIQMNIHTFIIIIDIFLFLLTNSNVLTIKYLISTCIFIIISILIIH